MIRLIPGPLALLLLASPVAFAQNPLLGSWKYNAQKSHLAGDTITFAPAPGGATYTASGLSYSFKIDGTPATTPIGGTSSWTSVNSTTLQEVVKFNGSTLSTNVYHLSPDGKLMDVAYTGTKPSGESFHDYATYVRVAPGKDFFGKWKSTKVDASITGYQFTEAGDGMLLWTLPDLKATAKLKLDGKDYSPTGPTVPPGLTISLAPAGPRSYTMLEKKDGKTLFKATETVSADGKTLTEVGSPAGVNEPSTVVYDKS